MCACIRVLPFQVNTLSRCISNELGWHDTIPETLKRGISTGAKFPLAPPPRPSIACGVATTISFIIKKRKQNVVWSGRKRKQWIFTPRQSIGESITLCLTFLLVNLEQVFSFSFLFAESISVQAHYKLRKRKKGITWNYWLRRGCVGERFNVECTA